MHPALVRLSVVTLLLFAPIGVEGQVVAELDAYWSEVTRTVEAGDFEGYSGLYHPDAVLVSLSSGNSFPISNALAGWEAGFIDTREGRADASVAFRFSQRLHDETTAHETGIFRFTLTPEGGSETVGIVHFDALMVRKNGAWLMVMEYQREPATEDEWNGLK